MQNNLGYLIIDAIKKLYPTINGGYSYKQNEMNFDEALFWENQEFPKPTWEQIEKVLPIVKLEKAKEEKLEQLQENYKIAMSQPHTIVNAPLLDKLNKPIGFTDAFFVLKDPDSLKQETTIITAGLQLSILKYFEILNPDKHQEYLMRALNSAIPIPYATKNKEGNEVKIALTGAEVFNIFKHLFQRVQTTSSKFDNVKNQIENAKSIEELNKINISL
jgi:hypothetical protein